MFESDREARFAPVDADDDLADARRKFDRRTQNHEPWAELTDPESSRIDTKLHQNLGRVSS